jgi:hypothetical protein
LSNAIVHHSNYPFFKFKLTKDSHATSFQNSEHATVLLHKVSRLEVIIEIGLFASKKCSRTVSLSYASDESEVKFTAEKRPDFFEHFFIFVFHFLLRLNQPERSQ